MIDRSAKTKTWNEANVGRISKPDDVQRLSATDQEKALKGSEDIGSLLNQVSDPNWVDPKKNRRVGNPELGKDAFLKLMLAQMKNQDPTNPLDSHEMAAQLAQFSSLEQLVNINESLGAMKKDQDPMVNYQAVNFIGKSIASDTSKIIRAKGDKNHDIRFNLPEDVKKAKVTIKDATGTVVKAIDLQDLKQGDNKISWNGSDNKGIIQRAGNFSFEITAENDGRKVAAKTSVNGRVTGINFGAEGPVLMVGDQSIRLIDVKKIEDQTAKDQLNSKEQVNDISNKEVKKEMKNTEGALEAAPAIQGNLNQANISNEFLANGLKPSGVVK